MLNRSIRLVTAGLLMPAAAFFAVSLSACSGSSNTQISVTTAVASRGSLVKHVEFSGILAPEQTVNIFSELAGRATKVTAAVGDHVTDGQLLVQIDTRQLNAQLEAASAQVQSVEDQASQARIGIETAKANLDLAQKSFDRIEALFKNQAVPRNQMDAAQNKLELAKSAYQNAQKQYQLLTGSSFAQAKARVDLIKVQLSNGTITSPLDGVVTNRNVNPGEMVTMAVPVMTVSQTAQLKLQGTVSQDSVPLLSLGQNVKVLVDGMPGPGFDGTISQIGPVAATTGQYFPVVVALKNDGRLLAGMTAEASLDLKGPEGTIVPATAVQQDGGSSYVFTVHNGTVTRTQVELGLRNSRQVSIAAGISPGVTVATSNLGQLQDGMSVAVAN